MKKRFWFMLLAICLTFSMLAGCQSNKQQKSSNQKKGAKPTISVALESGGSAYVEGSPDINNDKYLKKVESLANVNLKLTVLPHENYQQSMQLLLSGGKLPGLLETKGINQPEIAPAVKSGVLLPLNDLINKYGPHLKKYIPKASWDSARVSKDGKIYGIPQPNPVRNPAVTYIRKDWLDKLGLKVPKTVDQYIKVLQAFKTQDPNGNGKADEIPFSARQNFAFGFAFFSAYGVMPEAWTYQNGKLVPNFIKPKMKQALQVYRKLYKEKLLDNDFLTQTGQDWDSKVTSGLVGMWANNSAAPDVTLERLKQNVPNAKIAIIPSPVIPGGSPGGIYPLGSTVSDFVWTIPKSAKNPKQIIKFLDWFYQKNHQQANKFFLYGLKGENYTMKNGKVDYKYPTTNKAINEQFIYQQWLHFTGPKRYLTDKSFIQGKPDGNLIFHSLQVAKNEGFKDDALGMPALAELQANPKLAYDGMWLEFAAKVVTGKESVNNFDQFVSKWKQNGGSKLIQQATDWYNKNKK